MPKFPKPWFRKKRGWYVTLDGQQIPLGTEREAAFEQYHNLMRQPRERKVQAASVVSIIDQFLDWVQKNRAAETYVWYQFRLQLFARKYADLLTKELKPIHVQQWIDGYAHLSSGSRRNYARAVVRCMSWAEEQGLIERSTIARFKKPKAGVRQTVITPEEYAAILNLIPNEAFRDLLVFAWETGARAAECLAIEKRHVDLPSHRIVFPVDEEKMQRVTVAKSLVKHGQWKTWAHDNLKFSLDSGQRFMRINREWDKIKNAPVPLLGVKEAIS